MSSFLRCRFPSLITSFRRSSSFTHPQYEPGQELCRKNWRVVRVQDVPEFSLRAIELAHRHCGAKYLHFSSDDQMNAFSVSFKTTPTDSTGISHILEHTVLCGSEKYPVRDPFFKMLNRSLSSFMNAMTGPDYTFYPFTTQNKTDFYNLISVYLDAVFRPNLSEQDFRQEGWRLEQESLDDPNSKLIIKGVVFNEMKGVFADPQQLFCRTLLSSMLPSNTYGNCSGGIPAEIPKLTWQDLKLFHERHYSPHNAKFYSYGNLPLEGHLEALDEYMPKYEESKYNVPLVPNEVSWKEPRVERIVSAPDPSNPNSSTVSVSYLACDINDIYESFVLEIIANLLTDGANAPFYKDLIETGLASGFSPANGYEGDTKDTLFSVAVQGVKIENEDGVAQTIRNTMKKVVEEGFDKDRIDAILHRTELSLKNRGSNFGLGLIMSLTSSWNHNEGNPMTPLEINKRIERFRKDMEANPNFLQDKVKKYFVENQHQLTLIMSPDEKYVERQQAELDDLENKLTANLSSEKRQKLFEQAKKLLKAQVEKEDLSCLPTLKISEIADKAPTYEIQKTNLSGIPVQISAQPTNEVSFFRAILGTKHLSPEVKKYLGIFTMVLSSMGAGKFDYRRLHTEINLRTGGLSTEFHLCERPNDLFHLKEGILISSHCLDKNIDRMFELWSNIFNDLHLNSPERLRTLIGLNTTEIMNGLVYSAHRFAMGHSQAFLLPGTNMKEELCGLNVLRQLSKLTIEGGIDEVIANLQILAKELLNKEHMRVALNCTPQTVDKLTRATEAFFGQIPGNFSQEDDTDCSNWKSKSHRVYLTTPFPVHFCAKSVPIVPYSHEDFAALRVMARLLSLKFLHTEIREKGGAYGSGAVPNSSGVLSFFSYRDPNMSATLDRFDNSLNWLQTPGNFSASDVDEAKLGVFQKIDEPVVPGSRGMREFLADVNDEMFNDHRNALKRVSSEDVLRVAEKYLGQNELQGVTVIGPQPKGLDSTWKVENLV